MTYNMDEANYFGFITYLASLIMFTIHAKLSFQIIRKANKLLFYSAQHETDEEPLKLRSILGSSERSGQWVVPQNIYIENYMGSINLDFTDAIFTHQHVTIHVNCYLGSEEIYVPEHVNVVSKMFCILGSFENKTVSLNKRQGPTIQIEGKTVLGSVEVKVKRTIKEKFISFANDLKTQLGMNGKHY